MCGIAGFLSYENFFSEENLHQLTQALAHRGPDAAGYFFDHICGLGHRRLSILDLSEKANQPMLSHNERYMMVFNGEIYNYQELAKNLHQSFVTHSDSEVILELFSQKGVSFVNDLNGMFAIVIYDKQAQELLIFRDRIGIKPLFYYWDGKNFAFGSELKSLTKLTQVPLQLQQESILDFLHLGYIPAPNSIYQNIYKMPAGARLKISKQGLQIEKYWQIENEIIETTLKNEVEAKSQLKALLESSVKYQLISDVPLGVFLSGGIDSSLVAALATRVSTQKMNTFSIGFEEQKFNEAHYAQKVADYLQTNHHAFTVSTQEAKDLIPTLLDIYDEPFADSSAIPTMLVSALARKHVKVALCGDGGDELFFGYGMYEWAKRLNQLKTVRKPLAFLLSFLKANKYQKASDLFNYSQQEYVNSHLFSQEQYLFSYRQLADILTPDYQNLLKKHHPINFAAKQARSLTPQEQQAVFDLQYYLQDDLLVKVDRATMRYGLEARVPLLDHRIIEFALNLSPHLKVKNGVSKYLLKQVLYDYIPAEFFARPKQGFSIPLIDWLKNDLRYLLEEYLNPTLLKESGLVDVRKVGKMKKSFLEGNSYHYNRLWALVVLHRFLDKK